MIEAVQHADETIFIPPSWYHAILNLDDFTVAATSNTLSFGMLEEQWEEYREKYPEFCRDTLLPAIKEKLLSKTIEKEKNLEKMKKMNAGHAINEWEEERKRLEGRVRLMEKDLESDLERDLDKQLMVGN